MVFKLKKINPIARLIAYTRRRKQIVPPKTVKVLTVERTRIKRTFPANCYISNYHLTNVPSWDTF